MVVLLCCLFSAPLQAVEFLVEWAEGECIETFPVEAMVSWNAESAGVEYVEVRVGAVDGALLSTARAVGSAPTGSWVNEATDFYLVSVPDGAVLARTRLATPSCRALEREAMRRLLDQASEDGQELVEFQLSPPRLIYCGRPVERTAVSLRWNAEAVEADVVQIYLESETGRLFVQGDRVGEAETRDWVRDGTTFVLYLPEYERVAARREFRILSCAQANPR